MFIFTDYPADRGKICFKCKQQLRFECDQIELCGRDDVSNRIIISIATILTGWLLGLLFWVLRPFEAVFQSL